MKSNCLTKCGLLIYLEVSEIKGTYEVRRPNYE
jgi:hypothetical protein